MRVSELVKRQWRFSRMLCCLLEFIFDEGYEVSFGDVWRSTDKLKVPGTNKEYSYQELLKENGKSKVTYSKHNMRCAADLIIRSSTGKMLSSEEYRRFGEFWEKLEGTWGGRFGVRKEDYNEKVGWDPGHFEL